jgi:hypothetical protein
VERRYVEAHHVVHWIDGGPTDLDNLVLLCWHHHHSIHEGGYSIALSAGAVSVWRPDGYLLQCEALLVPTGPGIVELNEALGVRITAKDVASKWEGPGSCDYGMAIDALLGLEDRYRREVDAVELERDAATQGTYCCSTRSTEPSVTLIHTRAPWSSG